MCLDLSSARANTCKWLSETRGSADGGDFSCTRRSVSGTIRERGKHKRTSWLTLVQSNNGEATSECGWQKKNTFQNVLKLIHVAVVPLDLASFTAVMSGLKRAAVNSVSCRNSLSLYSRKT